MFDKRMSDDRRFLAVVKRIDLCEQFMRSWRFEFDKLRIILAYRVDVLPVETCRKMEAGLAFAWRESIKHGLEIEAHRNWIERVIRDESARF